MELLLPRDLFKTMSWTPKSANQHLINLHQVLVFLKQNQIKKY